MFHSQHAADQLNKDAEQWEDNIMVVAAKRMAGLMKKMANYTRYTRTARERYTANSVDMQ